jgi:glutathione S-transferase
MLKIWGRPDSICTQRVLWTCVEVDLDFELILASATMGPDGHVSTGAKPHGVVDTPWYRARNPNGTVPTIEDEDFVLWESNAIVAYLAARHGSQTLFGGSHQVFGQASAWMAWTNQYMEPVLHTLVMELVRLESGLRTPGAAEAAAESIAPALAILDAHLAEREFMTGEHFTMGDIPAGAAFYRWTLFDMGGPATPNADRWLSQLAGRDGFRQHVEPRHKHLG